MSVLGHTVTMMGSGVITPPPSSYTRSLTINHTSCGSVDSTNFPIVVSLSDVTLRSVSNGGHITRVDGNDILFYSDVGLTTLLNWELEHYDPINGILIAWVSIPTVSATIDTVFYINYGSSNTLFLGGAAGIVWSLAGGYNLLTHFDSNGGILSVADSTNTVAITNNGATANSSGKIGSAANFNGSTNYMSFPYSVRFNLAAVANTAQGYWFNYNNLVQTGGVSPVPFSKGTYDSSYDWGFMLVSNTSIIFYSAGTSNSLPMTVPAMSPGSWYHIVFSRLAGINKVYFNGVLMNQNSMKMTNTDVAGPIPIGVYGDVGTKAGYFNGSLDQLFFMKGAGLTDSDVTTMYNNQNKPGNIGLPAFMTISSE